MAFQKNGHWEVLIRGVAGGEAFKRWVRRSKENALSYPPEDRRFVKNLQYFTDDTCTERK